MDTRSKIVGSDRVAELAAQGAQIASGHFDPLISSFAEELAAIKQKHPEAPLVVLIRSSQNPILPARARAELVAALAVVDYVSDAESNVEPSYPLETEHEHKLRDLIAQVHGRQNAHNQGSQL